MATILVVDDELVFCELLKTLLKSHGHEVLTANNGRQALEVFKQHRPQFTMLDLRMPEMDGLAVLKQIRAIDTTAAVMILTAWGSDALELQARKLGVTDFLSKSLSLDTIVASLQRGLMQPAQAARAPKLPEEKTRASFGMLEANTILLVDNKPQTSEHLSKFLSQRGYQVHVAKDGPAVLELVVRVRPQLVVMDMELPGLKGIEVLRTLRAKKYTGGFVMMTAKQDDALLKAALDLGSADILGKPVEPERLLVAVQVGLVLLR
ncbi:MAG TPA: response regulator [Nitrospirales bacterium]|nr:response regulator [Nitrospirales bacterium]